MQEKISLLLAKWEELEDAYGEYLESEYDNNAPVHWCKADEAYEGPDFQQWTNENCLKFFDWVAEKADDDLIEEILIVVNGLSRDIKSL